MPTCAHPTSMRRPDSQLSLPDHLLIQADVTPTSPSGGHGRGPRLYVGGVPDEITEEDIVEHFNKWGQVVDCYFPGESQFYCCISSPTAEMCWNPLYSSHLAHACPGLCAAGDSILLDSNLCWQLCCGLHVEG